MLFFKLISCWKQKCSCTILYCTQACCLGSERSCDRAGQKVVFGLILWCCFLKGTHKSNMLQNNFQSKEIHLTLLIFFLVVCVVITGRRCSALFFYLFFSVWQKIIVLWGLQCIDDSLVPTCCVMFASPLITTTLHLLVSTSAPFFF